MYLAAVILLCLLFVVLSVAQFFVSSAKWAKNLFVFSVFIGIAGIIGCVAVTIAFNSKIASVGDPGFSEWASNVFSGYLKDTLPACAVIMAVVVLSAIFQPKMLPLRSIVISLTSVFVLIFGYITTFLADNKISIKKEIVLFSAFLALAASSSHALDFRRSFRRLSDEETAMLDKKKSSGTKKRKKK